MRIAVLIPVYNAAKFLPQCLDSVLEVEREGGGGGIKLEVFCCNDGSTDASPDILNDYAAHHANLHVLSQPNAGVVAARNRLLDALPPEIEAFAFVDADDYVAPGMYAKLAEALARTRADVAECEWDGPERVIDDLSVYWLKRTAPGRWINVINKLYRRSSVGGIRFRPGLAFEEDYFFNCEVHAAIRRKVLVPGFFYTYRTNPDSATRALDLPRYFDSTTRRIRLSLDEFLRAGRVPKALESAWRAELAKDAYRMCLRKNLKKNRDPRSRRRLFAAAGDFFRALERDYGFSPVGLNFMQKAVYDCCRRRRYAWARALIALT